MEMPVEARPDLRSSRSRSPRSQPSRPPPPSSALRINDLGTLQRCHDDAFKLINSGLSADEQGRSDDARAFYQSGLQSVNKILKVNCDNLQGSDEDKDKAKTILSKLNKTKLQVEYRLQALQSVETAMPSAPQSMDTMEPPSYEDATRSDFDAEFAALGDSIMTDSTTDNQSLTANATETYCIPDGVQIFFITPEGYVSAPSYPSALKIFKFNDQEAGASNIERPPAFLQVGDWFYPLQPGSSPALQTNYGAYVFPDVYSAIPGAAVGLMMPDTVSQQEREHFEQVLGSMTMLHHQEATQEVTQEVTPVPMVTEDIREEGSKTEEGEVSTTSTKIAKGLITAAEYISWGVGKGAEKAGEWMKQGTDKLKTRMRPEQPRPIDPRVQTGIRYARKGSHAAVQVSSYIVSKLGQATMALAREAAPHIRKQGEKYMPKSLKSADSDGKSKLDGVLEVAASGLHGFGTVYMSLEQAAKVLGKSLADQTVDVVSHKYGSEAGQLTENALYATGNLALTAHNANNLGVKAVAKRAAKDTGKAVLNDLSEQRKMKRQPPEKPPPPSCNGKHEEKR